MGGLNRKYRVGIGGIASDAHDGVRRMASFAKSMSMPWRCAKIVTSGLTQS
jgi:hypothetical protein